MTPAEKAKQENAKYIARHPCGHCSRPSKTLMLRRKKVVPMCYRCVINAWSGR